MTDVQMEVAELNDEVAVLFDEVATLFDAQTIHDARIFNLELETSGNQ